MENASLVSEQIDKSGQGEVRVTDNRKFRNIRKENRYQRNQNRNQKYCTRVKDREKQVSRDLLDITSLKR